MAKKIARNKKYLNFKGRMVMVGFGSIGQGVLPLIFRHIDIKPEQIKYIGISHYHGDHIGQVNSFPNSTLLIDATAKHATAGAESAKAISTCPANRDCTMSPLPL